MTEITPTNEQKHEEEEVVPPSEELTKNDTSAMNLLTGRLMLAVLSACFGSIGVGTAFAYSGTAVPQMEHGNSSLVITKDEGDWFGSVISLGALAGGLITGLLIDNLGRRLTFILMASLFGAGYVIIAFSVNFAMLLSGRILVGLCVGIIIISVPIYIAELSPPSIRGLLTALAQVSFTFGVLFSFVVGYFFLWNYLALACAAWPILMAVSMFFMPESPSWLIKKGKAASAFIVLNKIRSNSPSTNEEFEMLCKDMKRQQAIGGFDMKMMTKPTVYKPLLISIFLMVAMPLTGINAIIFNVVFIFRASGSSIDPRICSIIIGAIQFVATSMATLLIERFGRRPVLLSSCIGMLLSHGALGIYYTIAHFKGPELSDKLGWFPLLCLIFYILFFVGFGLGPWVIIPEISPFRVRGFISSVANASQWISVFITTKEFSDMLEVFGIFGTHFFYFGCVFISFVVIYVFLPETKGFSFEEIEGKFEKDLVRFLLRKSRKSI